MASKLSIEDRIELILMYARQDSSHRGVAAEFNRKHPDKHPITRATVKVFKRFRFRNVQRSCMQRINKCRKVQGRQFEHLLQ